MTVSYSTPKGNCDGCSASCRVYLSKLHMPRLRNDKACLRTHCTYGGTLVQRSTGFSAPPLTWMETPEPSCSLGVSVGSGLVFNSLAFKLWVGLFPQCALTLISGYSGNPSGFGSQAKDHEFPAQQLASAFGSSALRLFDV